MSLATVASLSPDTRCLQLGIRPNVDFDVSYLECWRTQDVILPRSSVEKVSFLPWQESIFYHQGTLKVHFWESFPCRLLHNISKTFTLRRSMIPFFGQISIGVRDWTLGSNDDVLHTEDQFILVRHGGSFPLWWNQTYRNVKSYDYH